MQCCSLHYTLPACKFSRRSREGFNFLCISVFFDLLLFIVFFNGIYCWTNMKHNSAKINWFQPIKVKISLYLWIFSENPIYIDFVHKIMILSHFGRDENFLSGRGLRTERAGATNLVSKVAQRLKEKSHETSRRCLIALRTYCAKRRGGGWFNPPPVLLGLRLDDVIQY